MIARSDRVWVKGGCGQRRVGRPRLRSRALFDGVGSNSIARGMDDGGTKRRRQPGFFARFPEWRRRSECQQSQRRASRHPALQQFNTERLALNTTSALSVSSTFHLLSVFNLKQSVALSGPIRTAQCLPRQSITSGPPRYEPPSCSIPLLLLRADLVHGCALPGGDAIMDVRVPHIQCDRLSASPQRPRDIIPFVIAKLMRILQCWYALQRGCGLLEFYHKQRYPTDSSLKPADHLYSSG